MNKFIALTFIGMLSLILSGCGDKNTITYDFKENKVELSDFDSSIQLPSNIKYYSYMDIVMAVYKNCNLDEKSAWEMRSKIQKGDNYISPTCSNGITYKFINTDKAPKEY